MNKKTPQLIALLLFLLLTITGCGAKETPPDTSLALPVAAYQFAKSEVQVLLPIPYEAVFPLMSEEVVSVEEQADGIIVVSSLVSYSDPDVEEIVTDLFTVTLKHLGDGLFETQSIVFTE